MKIEEQNLEKIHISASGIVGRGLFATVPLKKGEIIFLVDGPIIHYPSDPNYRTNPHGLNINKNTWRLPLNNNPWRYLNHSCHANVGLLKKNGRLGVVAMRNIKKDEELVIDYAITEADRTWHMHCKCGEKNCRQKIRSIQFLPQRIFEQYLEFIPQFLQKEYRAEKTYVGTNKHPLRGIYAKDKIKKDEIIFTIEGPMIKYPFPINYRIGPLWFETGKHSWIIPLENNPWHHNNHSCAPNSGLKGKNQVVAMRNIARDEEITIDYSITEVEPDWKMSCRCGAPNCRGTIRSIQFLPRELFKKYEKYIPEFHKSVYRKNYKLK